ncbi:MAG TPA: primosomal protein N', partial [Anaerolineaceae bacterium]|nr:primosomal protein N' [Anaerolineaceae bacterium]
AQARREAVAPARFPQALARRQAVLDALLRAGDPLDAAWLYAETGATLADLKALEKQGLIRLGEAPRWRDPLADAVPPLPATPPPLTTAQQAAWEPIRAALRAAAQGHPPAKPFLLHGVTGSGKTEIYLRAVAETLAQGRQAVVLVPEIALTPQTVQRFLARFAGRVGVLHSRLSDGERYDTWRRVRRGEVEVLIGPRSALFAPFPNLGLIVVDECHDEAYYQGDKPPHYHARWVAQEYARLTGAVCLLGSATPEVTTYYRARRSELTYLHLPARILAHREQVKAWLGEGGDSLTLTEGTEPQGTAQAPQSRQEEAGGSTSLQGSVPSPQVFRQGEGEALFAPLPPVRVADMRAELRAGHTGIFSRPLLEALDETLRRGEQAILFLNRRGMATYVFCRDCGHVLQCPRCEIPLTYHRHQGRLVCHHCGYTRRMPQTCPVCGGERIRAYGAGTERVEAEVRRYFPQARPLRWDAESVRGKAGHEVILSHFVHRRADVLIGTQMLAKGLDLPFVTLVGVVLADVGLTLPDYRAAERTFQVLTQVAGRAGRSPLGGRVILQTYRPEHYVIQAAARHDVAGFYATELAYRRRLGYPPFARLVRLLVRHRDNETARRQAEALAQRLRQRMQREGFRATQMIGPAPCFFAREAGLYRWHIILRGPDPTPLLRGMRLPAEWEVEVSPPSLL